MLKHLLAMASILLAAYPAFAGETPWVEVAPDARLRLVSSDIMRDGKTWAAIELDMPAAMKTYWRIPGETGIPAQLDISGSTGISGHQIAWPYPAREKQAGYIDFVYHGETVLPVELHVSGGSPVLKANIIMGVCDEICVPVHNDFELPLNFSKPDSAQNIRIRQARADVPLPWDGNADVIGDVTLNGDGKELQVEFDPAVVDPASLIVDNGDPSLLFSLPQKSRAPQIVSFQILGRGALTDLQGKPVRFTFLTKDGAYETTRVVGKSGS